MSYPGTRRDIFNGEGKGPTVRRDILLEATQALFGVIRLATASEISAGAIASGSKGPAVLDVSQVKSTILTPMQNLTTSLNNEISARGNADTNLQNQISSLQSQINSGVGECIIYRVKGVNSQNYKYPRVYLPAGGTWCCLHSGIVGSSHFFLVVNTISGGSDVESGEMYPDTRIGFEMLAGGSEVHIGSYGDMSMELGSAVIAWKIGAYQEISRQ